LNVGSCNEGSWAVGERHGLCAGVSVGTGIPHAAMQRQAIGPSAHRPKALVKC
jgi:hypothetical protein